MPEAGRGEIGQLGTSFNTMARSLEESREQARHAHERLGLLYEASIAIGTTLDAEQTARELVRVLVPRFADFVTVDLALPVLLVDESLAGQGAWARRVALGGVRDAPPLDPVGAQIALSTADAVFVPDLRTASAWQARHGHRARRLLDYGMHLADHHPAVLAAHTAGRGRSVAGGEPRPVRGGTSCPMPRRSPPRPPWPSTTPSATPVSTTRL
ncbi:hypothetical protein GCM10017687_47580 [Streptomyces echinatus]|uniref:hypothetical protein n=1 Tax=Streptomyces echinatus TaxID=67293 RepID=UPI0031EF9FF4